MAKEVESLAISVFCEDMAMMLEAGIAPEEALGLLAEDMQNSDFHGVLKEMEKEMILGSSFSAAVEKSGAFPEYASRMISTGEAAGRLDQVLKNLSGYYERQEQRNRHLQNALIYPVVLLLMMSAVLLIMVTLVLPVFVKVYENMTGVLAASSYRYITVASVISWVSLVVIGLFSLLILAAFLLYKARKANGFLRGILQKLPMTRETMYQLEVSRVIDVLATFLSSGMDVDTSVENAAGMVTHPRLEKIMKQVQREMADGKGLAQALYDNKVLPPLYARMLLSASRSGQLEPTLVTLADVTEIDAEQKIQRLISAIEPVLTGFLTVSVGVTLLSIMLPLAGMLSAIG